MRQAGATQNARLTPMLNPVSFLATPPGHTPGRGLVLLWLQPVGRASARNETPAQDGCAYSPAGFLPSAAFATSGPSVGIFWRLRLGASAQRSAVYLRADSRTRASSRAPEYFQSRIALKQRTVENVHSQRFQKLSKGSRTVGACYSTRLSTSWSNFPSVLPSFLRMTVLGSLRTKLRVLPLSFLRVMVSPLSATTVNPPV